ncbi:putative nucleotide sugar transporter [Leishmania infantum JPCM5]|uniref:Nucleotide_sugar_transporter_-_putative n=2 Tax=Leishmania infantum TaxID=5671 RepID=A0A6L0WY52_LEIIN|nr:putative nucleotide sugar transporter [Leishmania infantum JPCM5]CAC9472541.1 nucleotide_sugar_transporter_-_putative [Leishmania infantum]CAM66810.1 putative nucleotide sugar transporter [Leishmania infantum JPCM5]SUZ40504.1 nucleotide_sugar_transporter_-_putative [Leishmania infantum]|eukprot:XP_001464423.1 putative nucleotide sugar transporter [Leishmania infantum JPCM5]
MAVPVAAVERFTPETKRFQDEGSAHPLFHSGPRKSVLDSPMQPVPPLTLSNAIMFSYACSRKSEDDESRGTMWGVEDSCNSSAVMRVSCIRGVHKASEEREVLFPPTEGASAGPPSPPDSTLPFLQSAALAATYMLTSMFFVLTIRYTENHHQYCNDALIIFAIELAKLAVSVALKYREDAEFLPVTLLFTAQRREIWRGGLSYAVASLLYTVYNNVAFANLKLFHAGTYQVFMQTRILFTGIFFSLLPHHALTVRKWVALVLLMIGVASKYYSPSTLQLGSHVLFILLQALLSSMAGVYNEYALKKERHLSIHQQNFFMYLYAIIFNAVFGLLADPSIITGVFAATTTTATSTAAVAELNGNAALPPQRSVAPLVVLLILFGSATGISAAFMLKFVNVIAKAFASALEVPLTAAVAAALLGEPFTGHDAIAACIVMTSIYMYYTCGWGDDRTISCRSATS